MSAANPTEGSFGQEIVLPRIEPKEWWAMWVHGATLAWLLLRFIARYSRVIFRELVLEMPLPKAELQALNEKTANEYVKAAMHLKGGTIKIGQFASARADVMPPELVRILGQLQDRVEAAPWDYVEATLREQYGRPPDEVFASIEHTAVAAASFGQVHRAVTKQGEHVVVKVLHRHIERSLAVDLSLFRVAVFFFGRLFPRFSLETIYEETAAVTLLELDYAREAKSAARVREILAGHKRVRVPKVLWDYCGPRVLCLEDISGERIDDRAFIERTGGSPREVLRTIVGAYCEQIYVAGFFQSDPHPGNFFYYPPTESAPDGPLVGIIDFGQAKEMPAQSHTGLRRAVLAVLQRDAQGFLDAMVELNVIETAELHKVRHVVDSLASQIKTGSVAEVMQLDYESLARDVARALRDLEALSVPNDLILYGRTLGLLHGLGFKLDPDLPVFEVAAPYLMKFAFGDEGSARA